MWMGLEQVLGYHTSYSECIKLCDRAAKKVYSLFKFSMIFDGGLNCL